MLAALEDYKMSYFEKKDAHTGSVLGPSHPSLVPAVGPAFRSRPGSEHDSARSSLVMRNLVVDGHRTTVRLEPAIWDVLRDIADQQEVTVHNLVSAINKQHIASSLSSAIRAYVVVYLFAKLPDAPSTNLAMTR